MKKLRLLSLWLSMLLAMLCSPLAWAHSSAEQGAAVGVNSALPALTWMVNSIESPEVVYARYAPLIDYLSAEVGRDIEMVVPRSYEHGNELISAGQIDVAILGPAPYVTLKRASPGAAKVLLSMETNHTPYFYGAIVVRKDSAIQSVSELSGKRFGFGNRTSTLSFYLPAFLLLEAGVTPQDLKQFTHLQRHDVVAEHVIMGRQDAGGIKSSVANKYSRYLRVLKKTSAIRDHALVVSSGMDVALQQRIKSSLLSLKDAKVLQSVKPSLTGFIPAQSRDYVEVEKIMEQVDKAYGRTP